MTSLKHCFLSEEDRLIGKNFLDDGYIIADVNDGQSVRCVRAGIFDIVSRVLDHPTPVEDHSNILNQIHLHVDETQINDLRLHVMSEMNQLSWFREAVFRVARNQLESLVGNELAMQSRVNLSVQMPSDRSSVLPIHADSWAGDSPFEVVVWIPLVNCFGTKGMFLAAPDCLGEITSFFGESHLGSTVTSEDLFKKLSDYINWIEIPYGQFLMFNQNLPHGNRVNNESETRWSLNCRFKSLFSPYGKKNLGEFFHPITIRAASRMGLHHEKLLSEVEDP